MWKKWEEKKKIHFFFDFLTFFDFFDFFYFFDFFDFFDFFLTFLTFLTLYICHLLYFFFFFFSFFLFFPFFFYTFFTFLDFFTFFVDVTFSHTICNKMHTCLIIIYISSQQDVYILWSLLKLIEILTGWWVNCKNSLWRHTDMNNI